MRKVLISHVLAQFAVQRKNDGSSCGIIYNGLFKKIWRELNGINIMVEVFFFLSERKPSFCLSFRCEGVPIYILVGLIPV